MRKDKEAGMLWMNVEEIKFENARGFYFLRSTKELDSHPQYREQRRPVRARL